MKTFFTIAITVLSINSFAVTKSDNLTKDDKERLNKCFSKLREIEVIFDQDLDLWQSIEFHEESKELKNDYVNICSRYLELFHIVKE